MYNPPFEYAVVFLILLAIACYFGASSAWQASAYRQQLLAREAARRVIGERPSARAVRDMQEDEMEARRRWN